MSHEEDPEVIADLQLRAYSEHDSSRTRGAGVYDWKKAGDVAWWPCAGACGDLVGVTEDICEYRHQFNGYLRKRMEADIPIDRIVLCPKCRTRMLQERAYRKWEQKERVAKMIRELKDQKDPATAKDLIKNLEEEHHPDIKGLIEAIESKRSGGNSVRRKASGL